SRVEFVGQVVGPGLEELPGGVVDVAHIHRVRLGVVHGHLLVGRGFRRRGTEALHRGESAQGQHAEDGPSIRRFHGSVSSLGHRLVGDQWGTLTVVARWALLPFASRHSAVSVYTRPLPVPARSARRSTVSGPVICQSTSVWPSPVPSTDSLLLT